MTPQIFRGSTLSEARSAAVAALGEGAVLHTTRAVPRKGVAGWLGAKDFEVSATPPERPQLPASPQAQGSLASPSQAADARRAFTSAAYEERLVVPAQAQPPSDINALRAALRAELRAEQAFQHHDSSVGAAVEAELAALRSTIEAMQDGEIGSGAAGRILRAAGIEGKAAMTLTGVLRDNKRPGALTLQERFREAIADIAHVAPWPLADEGPQVIAMVGPSGVGKTTTAAKLAARAILDQKRSVTFISCDAFRVGAVEQLRRYAALMDAKFEIAATPRDLARAIGAAGTDLVIVDTAGRAPGRGGSIAQALGSARTKAGRAEIFAGRSRHVLLVLPANLRARDAEAFVRAFAPAAPTAIAMTKLDETRSPAALVHGSVAAKLPVTTLCFGQRVPEDIAPATSGAILDYVAPSGRSALSRRGIVS